MMAQLKGFYNEEILNELLYNEEITRLDHIYHHSQERIDEYKQYCQTRNLKENENSALAFFEYLLLREESSHTEYFD